MKVQKILIATGIFPPQIGGPSQYAKESDRYFRLLGFDTKVVTYRWERFLPTGVRHFLFFLKTLFSLPGVDIVIALDTFSVGWPTVLACKLFGKKIIIRTGGDFLWEFYVERTGDLVLLSDFYESRMDKFNLKEKVIFKLTRFTLRNVDALVFSTEWQRGIFEKAYGLDKNKSHIIENFYGEKIESLPPEKKVFVGGTRDLQWKNLDFLKSTFLSVRNEDDSLVLDVGQAPYEAFLNKIQHSYATILVSLGDISPNMILDSIRANKPFILTKENGLTERIKDIALFVDPKSESDVKEKILWLSKKENYEAQKKKVEDFKFTHSWEEICREFVNIAQKI